MSADSRSPRMMIASTPVLLGLLLSWAVLLAISFPRPGWWVPAHFALLPLALVATRGQSLRKTALLIYLVSLVWWVWMLRWLVGVTGPGYVGLAAYCAIYPLIFSLMLRAATRRLHLPLVFTVPLFWVTCEYLRGAVMLTGFPWFNLGHTQPISMIQIADTVGAYGVSFVVAMSSGLLADLLTNPLVTRGGGIGKSIKLATVSYLIVIVATVGYGRVALIQEENRGFVGEPQSIRIGVVQTDILQSNKNFPTEEQSRADFAGLLELTEQAMKDDPHLVVWPETVVPRSLDDETLRAARFSLNELASGRITDPSEREGYEYWAATLDYYRQIVELVRRHTVYLIAGSHAYENLGEPNQKRFNCAYLIAPNGQRLDRYEKVHRVPFGEYILFEDSLPWLADLLRSLAPLPSHSLSAGESFDPLVMTLPGSRDATPSVWSIGTPICFEDAFSSECRQMVYAGGQKRADLLVNLTNDGWYPDTDQPLQHEQIARLRCVENRVPMARSVNRGVSALIDSTGRIVAKVQVDGKRQSVAGVVGAELYRDGRVTIFGRWGDWFALFCSVLTALMMLIALAAARLNRNAS